MLVKLYHDEEGDVDEAGKQSDMPTLRMVPIAASAGHRWSRSACMGNRGGGWAMSEFGGTAAAAAAVAAREEEKVVVGLAQRID